MALAINVTAKTLLPLYRACTHRIDLQSQSSDPQAKAYPTIESKSGTGSHYSELANYSRNLQGELKCACGQQHGNVSLCIKTQLLI
jgi:hypothetical protein